MNAKTVRISNILAAAMLLLHVVGVFLGLLINVLTSSSIVSLPVGAFLCLALALPSIVLLTNGIIQAKRKQGGVFDIIFSILSLLVSAVWMAAYFLNWVISVAQNVIIEYYYRLDWSMPLGQLITLLSYASMAYMLFTTLIAVYLLVVYVVSVLRAKNKWSQIKAELHKPALAVLLLVPNLISLVRSLLNRIAANWVGPEGYATFLNVTSVVVLILNVLLSVAAVVLLLTFGLILKKQPASVEPAAQSEQTAPAADIDLPTGISADDLSSCT